MIDVETAFAEFVPTFGGRLVESMVGKSPNFANADYLFEKDEVVVELKRLADDKSEDLALQNRIQAKFDSWMDDRTIPLVYGKVRIESKSLPLSCQLALIDLYKPPIQRRIIKANKQIKATMQHLHLRNHKGVLLLVNDGNYAVESNAVLFLVGRILGKSFRHINSVLYCTVNMFATAPLTAKPTLVWVHATRNSVAASVPDEWAMAFFRGWSAHLSQYLGAPIEEILVVSSKDLEGIRYIRET